MASRLKVSSFNQKETAKSEAIISIPNLTKAFFGEQGTVLVTSEDPPSISKFSF